MPRILEAARIAVDLREDDPVERDPLLERERDVHSFLPRHRVDHEQHVRRLGLVADSFELLHQLLVHVQAARRVEDDRVDAVFGELPDTVMHDRDRIGALPAIDGNLDLLAELLELVDRRGPLQVGGDETRAAALLPQQERELRRGRRLTRALQAGEQDHRRRPARERKLRAAGPHQGGQLVVDGLHDLLARLQALQNLLAKGALAHLGDELLDDLEVDVGLEQGETDLAHGPGDRLLVELSAPAKVAESALESV